MKIRKLFIYTSIFVALAAVLSLTVCTETGRRGSPQISATADGDALDLVLRSRQETEPGSGDW
ncbi:MAG: hypothetical protein WD266_11535, partial [Balneolales bacterium]